MESHSNMDDGKGFLLKNLVNGTMVVYGGKQHQFLLTPEILMSESSPMFDGFVLERQNA